MSKTQYPLNNKWCVWAHRQSDSNSYANNTITLTTIGTVETFWRMMNNLPKPSSFFYDGNIKRGFQDKSDIVQIITAFSLFREGIHPSWEDPVNKKGGDYCFRTFSSLDHLDKCWELICIDCVGEAFEGIKNIAGVRVVDSSHKNRKLYKLEIWYSLHTQELEGYIKKIKKDLTLSDYIHKKHFN